MRDIFQVVRLNNAPIRAAPTRTSHLPGLITCTLPFSYPDGRSFVAIGCTEGIWVADARDPDFLHRVLDLKGTSEFAVIEHFRIFLVLADRVDALDPYSQDTRVPQKLSANHNVESFRVGIWIESLVIAYRRRDGLDSIFRFLEPHTGYPIPEDLNPADPDPIVTDLGNTQILHFKTIKEIYIPESCNDIMFFRTYIAVLRNRGVELIFKQTLETQSMLDTKDPRFKKSLAKRCKAGTVRGISRTRNGDFLICYDTFGLLIDRYGTPLYSTTHTIDWHGPVHTFIPLFPYVVLFKPTSLEIRDGTTGALEQVIFGPNMRCTWRGPSQLDLGPGALDEDSLVPPQEAHERSRVMYVLNAPGVASVGGEVSQHVYNLVLKMDEEQQ
ncbi:hypothetical protein M422DRAFT_252626 [Sphaerobolus stellatus SS14]|uniref:Unplaced genomic scaffold SPHSTscaffold_44, whole genome shotgun sequence n=1 Tax=Sphaerobolus stellatus (strain SS14) TaxID=990650 RepID=A0A0C9VYN1_SPHS4|nr:hypothetical protein M422DRAFT_252626 [Sphaerobolus stellatus SS14]